MTFADGDERIEFPNRFCSSQSNKKRSYWKRRKRDQGQVDSLEEGEDFIVARAVTALQKLEDKQAACVAEADFLRAHEVNEELLAVRKILDGLEVCPGCWITKPSARACNRGPETWAKGGDVDHCGHCGKALVDQIQDKVRVRRKAFRSHGEATRSLQRRAHAELEMALHVEKTQKPRAKKKSVKVVLAAKKKCGETPQGTVIRWKTKDIDREWMIGQLYRTRARLWPEADLRAERRALGLALVMLDAL